MAEDIQVQISQASIQQIINTHVQTAVMKALQPYSDKFVEQIVERVLTQKSSSERYRYTSESEKPTVLGAMIHDMIETETRNALKAWVEQNRPVLAEKLQAAIKRHIGWANKLSDQILESMVTATDYNFAVTVAPREKRS